MAAPGKAQVAGKIDLPRGLQPGETPALLTAMLRANDMVSDLIFSPGRSPQVEVYGQLVPVHAHGLHTFTSDDTRRIASDVIGNNKQAITMLREQGYCDVSYGLPGVARFRANIFIQRGSCAVVMRVIPSRIPDLAALGLPSHLSEISGLRDGIVLVSGPRGSGKSSTLAALLDRINEQQTCHIITIEDPIEFLHNHKRATIHQRELHSDTPSIVQAMRAALRQSPRVILLGEMRDRETTELVLEAAETGHLVLTSLNSVDASKTIDRIVGTFGIAEHASVRSRLAKTLRYVIARRLLPRHDGCGRVPVVEILKSDLKVQNCLTYDELPSQNLLRVIQTGSFEGMQHFDGEIEKLLRQNLITLEVALAHATDAQALQKRISDDYSKPKEPVEIAARAL